MSLSRHCNRSNPQNRRAGRVFAIMPTLLLVSTDFFHINDETGLSLHSNPQYLTGVSHDFLCVASLVLQE